MSEETKEAVAESSQSEVVQENTQENQAPEKEKAGLQEALIAERRKRQDAEALNRYLQQGQAKQPVQQQEDEDEYTRDIKNYTKEQIQNGIKQSIENQFLHSNPHIVEQDPVTGQTWLEKELAPILRKKPYLADVIKNADNRYARSVEIINDYTPKTVPENENRKRLEENANKPGNPAGVARSGNLNKVEQIRNMSRKEFSEYRASVRGKTPNIR